MALQGAGDCSLGSGVAMVSSFRQLRVYRAAFEAQMEIYALVRTWPRWERFLLTSQILRSSRSVCPNIAEAWRKRRYPAAFVAKLSDAEGEAEETRVHLETALACGYVDHETAARLDETYDAVLAGLSRMAQRPNAWRPPNGPRSGDGRKREENARSGGGRPESPVPRPREEPQ